jgi:hypothetical protein
MDGLVEIEIQVRAGDLCVVYARLRDAFTPFVVYARLRDAFTPFHIRGDSSVQIGPML